MSDLTLSNLVASRICHDLAGPLGALLNGIELIRDDDDPNMREAAIELLVDSLHQATSKLKLYRLAFGASGGQDQPVSLIEGRAAAVDYFTVGRISLTWDATGVSVDELSKNQLRILLNLILVAEASAPRGGQITVAIASGNPGDMRVDIQGDRIAMAPEIEEALQGRNLDTLEARYIASMLAFKLAQAENRAITVDISDAQISLTV